MFFLQFLESDKHDMLAWARDFDIFIHSFQMPTWRQRRAPAIRKVAGEGRESPVAPLHVFAFAPLAAAPWNMGEGCLIASTPCKKKMGEELTGPGDADLRFSLGHVHFLLTIDPATCPGKEVQTVPCVPLYIPNDLHKHLRGAVVLSNPG